MDGIFTNTSTRILTLLVTGEIALDEDAYQTVYIMKNGQGSNTYSNITTSGKTTAISGTLILLPNDFIGIYIKQQSGADVNILGGRSTRLILTQLDFVYGPTGQTGPTGPTGYTGAQGPDGTAANTGATGQTGPTGYTGLQGPAGTATNTGATGYTGFTGPEGPAGTATNTGATGTIGPPGDLGPPGDIGFTGPTGFTGDLGAPGDLGPPGDIGFTGPTGFTGDLGVPGDLGPVGDSGYTGSTGFTGPIGPTGPTTIQSSFNITRNPIALINEPRLLLQTQISVDTISYVWIMSTIEYRTLDTPFLLEFYFLIGFFGSSAPTYSSTSTYNQYTVISLQHRLQMPPGNHTISVYGYSPGTGIAEVTRCDVFSMSNMSG
jgi:hypothetical protein